MLLGPNGGGKTTACDAAYLSHRHRFPMYPRLSSAALGDGEKGIDLEYAFEPDAANESSLGRTLKAHGIGSGDVAGTFSTSLRRSLGSVQATIDSAPDFSDALRLVYLPASRHPVDELSRREAQILVELLRAEQQRETGGRNISGVRGLAAALLDRLSQHDLIQSVEARVSGHLEALSAGATRQWPYVRGQRVDDRYLARVLELMLAMLEGRQHARPLEVSGLGYVNLLHIAVTLAAIPDPEASAEAGDEQDGEHTEPIADNVEEASGEGDEAIELARAIIDQAEAEAESQEDSFFPGSAFHVTVIIEEPEAHLHPQLQHGLVRYLRRAVRDRRELQVIVSSHAADIITSCETDDLVVIRREASGTPVSRRLGAIPFFDPALVLKRARLHLDATRSAALFADRVVLVEGITDAAVLRAFAIRWAGDDVIRLAAVEALSIVPMGARVGRWPVDLLSTPGHELVGRLAVMTDSDAALNEPGDLPAWMTQVDATRVHIAVSEPTLEPAITPGNETLVAAALSEIGVDVPVPVDRASVFDLFKSRRVRDNTVVQDAGTANNRKADFSWALAAAIREAEGTAMVVPSYLDDLLQFVVNTQVSASTGQPDDPEVALDDASE